MRKGIIYPFSMQCIILLCGYVTIYLFILPVLDIAFSVFAYHK